jgi:hypothetical protein
MDSGESHNLYHLWKYLHYIWPRCTPHRLYRPAKGVGRPDRPTRQGFSAGVLRALAASLARFSPGVNEKKYGRSPVPKIEARKSMFWSHAKRAEVVTPKIFIISMVGRMYLGQARARVSTLIRDFAVFERSGHLV